MNNMQLNSPSRPVRARNAGFSLMEMLIVLGIMGLLVGIVITNFQGIFAGAETDAAEQFVRNSVDAPLTAYKIHMGNFPTTEQGLAALVNPPGGDKASRWKGPYIKDRKVPIDPWGNPYNYRYPGQHNPNGYDVWSNGPDGVPSADDIGNW